jgi:hypothetical protein
MLAVRRRRVRIARLIVLCLVGCSAAEPQLISWEPRDPDLVAKLESNLAKERQADSDGPVFSLEYSIKFDPLSVVSNQRIRLAFPQISETDERIYHCQMGSTASYRTTLEFSPRTLSTSRVQRKILECERDAGDSASLCRFEPRIAYYLDNPTHFYEVGDDMDARRAREIMSMLVSGSFESKAYGFPPKDWPADWYKDVTMRRLSALKTGESPDAPPRTRNQDGHDGYVLTFPGCGCWDKIAIERGNASNAMPLQIVDYWTICI